VQSEEARASEADAYRALSAQLMQLTEEHEAALEAHDQLAAGG